MAIVAITISSPGCICTSPSVRLRGGDGSRSPRAEARRNRVEPIAEPEQGERGPARQLGGCAQTEPGSEGALGLLAEDERGLGLALSHHRHCPLAQLAQP